MLEQETDLDTAIQQFQQVENFEEYKEGLLDVLQKSTKVKNPNEARERVMKIVDAKKADLMKNNPEFKSILDQRKRDVKMKADENRAIHKAQMDEAEAKAKMTRADAKLARSDAMNMRSDVDDWVAKTRIKIRTPEEATKALDDKLGCPNPKCDGHGENRGNVMNDIPTCMRCWHRLVPKSEFKDYNRKYWRAWARRKKRK